MVPTVCGVMVAPLLEPSMSFGAKNVTIEHSMDGVTLAPLGNAAEFARAPGVAGCTSNTIVSLGGVSAKYVKLTINKNWGVAPQTGLRDFRFFCIPQYVGASPPST